jgi:hypothetical protein
MGEAVMVSAAAAARMPRRTCSIISSSNPWLLPGLSDLTQPS